jgi:SOS response regulatory protein OraA/RecX
LWQGVKYVAKDDQQHPGLAGEVCRADQDEAPQGFITKMVFRKMLPEAEIWLDDQKIMSCHLDLVLKYQLETGMQLDAGTLENLKRDQLALEAWHQGLRYCYTGVRTRGEVRRRLRGKGYGLDLIEDIISRLERDYGLDDVEAARDYFERNQSRMGDMRIRNELMRRGVAPGVIDGILKGQNREARDEEAFESALELAKKKLVQSEGTDPRKLALRIVSLLQRRGYDARLIRKVLETLELKLYSDG